MKLLKAPSSLWVAERRGRVVYVRRGKPSAPGVPKAREHKTEEAAQAFLEAERDARLAEGYAMIDENAGLDTPFTADGKPRARTVPSRYAALADIVRMHVRAGFRSRDEISELVEQLATDAVSTARAESARRKQPAMTLDERTRDMAIQAHVAQTDPAEGSEKLADLLAWVADTERTAVRAMPRPDPCINGSLDAAFAELDRIGIVALQAAGFTQSDGWYDVTVAAERRGGARGGCFYHEQDLERGIRGEGLMLGFGALGGGDDVEIGHAIVSTLRAHGVETIWNETKEQRIAVPPFVWYRPITAGVVRGADPTQLRRPG